MTKKNIENFGDGANEQPKKRNNIINNSKENISSDLLASKRFQETIGRLSSIYNIKQNELGKNIKVSLTLSDKIEKGMQRGEPEIAITIQPSGKINFRINPYDHYEEYYYLAEGLDADELQWELENIQLYEKTGVPAQGTKLQKIKYPNPEEFDMDDYI